MPVHLPNCMGVHHPRPVGSEEVSVTRAQASSNARTQIPPSQLKLNFCMHVHVLSVCLVHA
eukprot:7012911-Ditylum_brightwellii.AAC.1